MNYEDGERRIDKEYLEVSINNIWLLISLGRKVGVREYSYIFYLGDSIFIELGNIGRI